MVKKIMATMKAPSNFFFPLQFQVLTLEFPKIGSPCFRGPLEALTPRFTSTRFQQIRFGSRPGPVSPALGFSRSGLPPGPPRFTSTRFQQIRFASRPAPFHQHSVSADPVCLPARPVSPALGFSRSGLPPGPPRFTSTRFQQIRFICCGESQVRLCLCILLG